MILLFVNRSINKNNDFRGIGHFDNKGYVFLNFHSSPHALGAVLSSRSLTHSGSLFPYFEYLDVKFGFGDHWRRTSRFDILPATSQGDVTVAAAIFSLDTPSIGTLHLAAGAYETLPNAFNLYIATPLFPYELL